MANNTTPSEPTTITEWLMDWHGWYKHQTYYGRFHLLKLASKAKTYKYGEHWDKIEQRRNSFDVKAHVKKKLPMSKECYLCHRTNDEVDIFFIRHHVIQLQYGGPNRRLNIITLCSLCHNELHYWMKPKTCWMRTPGYEDQEVRI